MSKRRTAVALALVVLAVWPAVSSADPTRDAVQAKRIKDRLYIEVRTDANQKPVLLYRIDRQDASRREFEDGLVFVADGTIAIGYPGFNPFDYLATVSITEVDDPAHAALGQLLQALTSVAGILRPEFVDKFKTALSAPSRTALLETNECQALQEAQRNLRELVDALYPVNLSASQLRKEIKKWRDGIADHGHSGVTTAMADLAALSKSAGAATVRGKAEVEDFELATLQLLGAGNETVAAGCRAEALVIYDLARLADPAERLKELEAVAASLGRLSEALASFSGDKDWEFDDSKKRRVWILKRVAVSEAKAKQVTVKAGVVAFSATDESGIASKASAETSAAFTLLQRRLLVPEIGVGAIIADLRRPKYVVGKNDAGESVVARGAAEEVPLSAAVMANLVWRTDLGIGAPMLQLGGLPSKDAPGVFGGVGLRFFARLGLGFGVVRWWAKDLPVDPNDPTLLGVNKKVATQKDIEDKLKWVPRNNFYITFQYSF
jgi:hypothetical protein